MNNYYLVYLGGRESPIPDVIEDGIEFLVLLPPPPTCWDYRSVSPIRLSEVFIIIIIIL